MKIYFAGYEAAKSLVCDGILEKMDNILVSFFYCKHAEKFRQWKNDGKHIFVDSGAFSAWSQKKDFPLKTYGMFIHKVKHCVDHYAVLDNILDPAKTLENQKTMEKNGLNPIPCFHYGEPMEYLEKYAMSYDYIALGGMVPISTKQLTYWLDTIFDAFDKQKFHGFGLTSPFLMKRYPWHSVDSSSWTMGGRSGSVITSKGTYDFSKTSRIKRTLGLSQYKLLLDFMEAEYPEVFNNPDTPVPTLWSSHRVRNSVNVLTFLKWQNEEANREKSFTKQQMELF